MQYKGRYDFFDSGKISTYPVSQRINKVKLSDLVSPQKVVTEKFETDDQESGIQSLAKVVAQTAKEGKPVIWFTGAHLIKNGLGLILIDLVRRGIVSLVATNGAGVIHDFELGLIGQTSEYVPNALPEGQFGMATELGYINAALLEGNQRQLGYGESVGRCICDPEFRQAVEKRMGLSQPMVFTHPEVSVLAECYQRKIPLTVHVGIGTDVIDQHPNFDGSAKGGCSGRDFLIFAKHVEKMTDGGIVMNVGSAVTGPEVFLKAISMVANVGKTPQRIITADFDLKPYQKEAMKDEQNCYYYFRDHKSVVTRIPEAFGGKGFYIQGNQKLTIPRLYQEIIKLVEK